MKINNSEKMFYLNQQLKCLARVALTSFIFKLRQNSSNQLSTAELILLAYTYKATDLFDGILQLQKLGLMEDAQILIRALFETNVNYGCFIHICQQDDEKGSSCAKVMESLLIMKEKDALEQEVHNPSFYELVKQIKEKYTYLELKAIKKYGFTNMHIEKRAELNNKLKQYQIMYRNFSRNVHGFDLIEYFQKIGLRIGDEEEKFELRNDAAISHTYECFFQILSFTNLIFKLGLQKELKRINKEFKKL